MLRRFASTVLLSLFALLLGTESHMLRAADKKPVELGAVDKNAPEEFTTTKSGLKYRVRRKGAGSKPAPQDTVSVHYKGWLDNGKEFDSSYGRGESIEFPLRGVIAGWTEGMQLVGKGGMIELEIPSALGYGDRGTLPDIPGKATLHFLVELLEVTEGPKPLTPGAVDKDAPKEFSKTASGLKYRILRKSDGVKPKASNTVTVHYKGTLDDGSQFDSSYDRGQPASFPLSNVISGWTEGMQLIGKGGMVELEIPFELAYGAEGRPPVIPPKARLLFIVELIEVK